MGFVWGEEALMPKLRISQPNKVICEIDANFGDTLLKAISDAGVYLDAPCGGEGRCGKCLVHVKAKTKSGAENLTEVLACLAYVDGDMDVYLPGETVMKIIGSSEEGLSQCKCNCEGKQERECRRSCEIEKNAILGVAIDIGTTTVVARLINLETGRRIGVASGVNAQRVYGADVISRIKYCSTNGHEKLTKLIRVQIKELIRQMLTEIVGLKSSEGLLEENSLNENESIAKIENIVIAGNTIMQHLAAGYSPVSMGSVPFDTISLFGKTTPVWEELLELPISPDAEMYYTPAIAAYVGGDVTAGVLAFETAFNFSPGGDKVKNTVLFLDIGTNGEIVLKHENKYYCCATAAGPAFEGAEIEMGTAAVNGAISHAAWNEERGELELTVIGEAAPIGICGSGLLDILAFLVEKNFVDETGRLEPEQDGLWSGAGNKDRFYITKSVYITPEDVRKLQLAKAAIAAGIQTLLSYVNITEEQVDALILAGGFGNFLDKKSAARIGLIPPSLLPVTHALGNTSLDGATIALCNEHAREKLEDIRNRMEYVELSTSRLFNDQFIEQMMFW